MKIYATIPKYNVKNIDKKKKKKGISIASVKGMWGENRLLLILYNYQENPVSSITQSICSHIYN